MIGNNLKEWYTGPVVVHQAVFRFFKGIGGMHELSGIFLQMNAFDPYGVGAAVIPGDFKVAVFTKRSFELGDLVSLRQVRIKVILSGKAGSSIDVAVEGEAGSYGMLNSPFVQYGECARLSCTDRAHLAVGRGIIFYRAVTKKF
jgi:hypothetical protein